MPNLKHAGRNELLSLLWNGLARGANGFFEHEEIGTIPASESHEQWWHNKKRFIVATSELFHCCNTIKDVSLLQRQIYHLTWLIVLRTDLFFAHYCCTEDDSWRFSEYFSFFSHITFPEDCFIASWKAASLVNGPISFSRITFPDRVYHFVFDKGAAWLFFLT